MPPFSVTIINDVATSYDVVLHTTLLITCDDYSADNYTLVTSCPNGYKHDYLIFCPALQRGEVNFTCPGYTTQPACLIGSGDGGASYEMTPHCEVVSYTEDNTTCLCSYNASLATSSSSSSSSRRKLLASASDASALRLSSALSVSNEVEDFFFTRLPNPQPRSVGSSIMILVAMGVCFAWVVGVILLLLVKKLYNYQTKRETSDHLHNKPGREGTHAIALYKDKQAEDIEENNTSTRMAPRLHRGVHRFFEDIFPRELRAGHWRSVWYDRLLRQHPVFDFFFSRNAIGAATMVSQVTDTVKDARPASDTSARMFSLALVQGRMLILVVLNVFLCYLLYPDNGNCEEKVTEAECGSVETLGRYFALCEWYDAPVYPDSTCTYHEPPLRVGNIFLIAAISLALMLPVYWFLWRPLLMRLQGLWTYFFHTPRVGPADGPEAVAVAVDTPIVPPMVKKKSRAQLLSRQKSASKFGTKAAAAAAAAAGGVSGVGATSRGAVVIRQQTPSLQHTCQSLIDARYDEIRKTFTRPSLYLRAARMCKMQRLIDRPSVEMEATSVVMQSQLNAIGWEGVTKRELAKQLAVRYNLLAYSSLPASAQLCHALTAVRHRSLQLSNKMDSLHYANSEAKESFLMRAFITETFHHRPLHYRVAKKYFVDTYKPTSNKSPDSEYTAIKFPLVALCTFGLTAIMLYLVFLMESGLGSSHLAFWGCATIASVVEDIFILQPLTIWMEWVTLDLAIAKEAREMTEFLSKRAKVIMQRRKGVMRDANAVIQHLNPACRAARTAPELPVARLLMSLNDLDIPSPSDQQMPAYVWHWPHALLTRLLLPIALLRSLFQRLVLFLIVNLVVNAIFILTAVFYVISPLTVYIVWGSAAFVLLLVICRNEAAVKPERDRRRVAPIDAFSSSLYSEDADLDGTSNDDESQIAACSSSRGRYHLRLAEINHSAWKQQPQQLQRQLGAEWTPRLPAGGFYKDIDAVREKEEEDAIVERRRALKQAEIDKRREALRSRVRAGVEREMAAIAKKKADLQELYVTFFGEDSASSEESPSEEEEEEKEAPQMPLSFLPLGRVAPNKVEVVIEEEYLPQAEEEEAHMGAEQAARAATTAAGAGQLGEAAASAASRAAKAATGAKASASGATASASKALDAITALYATLAAHDKARKGKPGTSSSGGRDGIRAFEGAFSDDEKEDEDYANDGDDGDDDDDDGDNDGDDDEEGENSHHFKKRHHGNSNKSAASVGSEKQEEEEEEEEEEDEEEETADKESSPTRPSSSSQKDSKSKSTAGAGSQGSGWHHQPPPQMRAVVPAIAWLRSLPKHPKEDEIIAKQLRAKTPMIRKRTLILGRDNDHVVDAADDDDGGGYSSTYSGTDINRKHQQGLGERQEDEMKENMEDLD